MSDDDFNKLNDYLIKRDYFFKIQSGIIQFYYYSNCRSYFTVKIKKSNDFFKTFLEGLEVNNDKRLYDIVQDYYLNEVLSKKIAIPDKEIKRMKI